MPNCGWGHTGVTLGSHWGHTGVIVHWKETAGDGFSKKELTFFIEQSEKQDSALMLSMNLPVFYRAV